MILVNQICIKNIFFMEQVSEVFFMLKKAIYGLKKSLAAWFQNFRRGVTYFDFKCCTIDPFVFIKHNTYGYIFLALFDNDICMIGRDYDVYSCIIITFEITLILRT